MDSSILKANLRKHWNDPGWWRDIAVPFIARTVLVQPYFKYLSSTDGSDVMSEDWDNLIILDACRFDMFTDLHQLPGELECRLSKGSNTAEFLEHNFAGGSFPDTVYVTANPQVNVNLDSPFHSVVPVWQDGWDEKYRTVRPETMADATREVHDTYPNKRLISHFVQPHYPFIGEQGRELVGDQAGIELSKRQATGESAESEHFNVWDLLRRGTVDVQEIWAAYRENLLLALPHVESLLGELRGRTVVTSDHGNLVGERPKPCPIPYRMYGHPPSVYADHLIKVPWLVSKGTERKAIEAGATENGYQSETREQDVSDRLRALGYLE